VSGRDSTNQDPTRTAASAAELDPHARGINMPRITSTSPLLLFAVSLAVSAISVVPAIGAPDGRRDASRSVEGDLRGRGSARRHAGTPAPVRAGWAAGLRPEKADAALRNLDASEMARSLVRQDGGDGWISVFVRGSVTNEELRQAGAEVQSEAGPLRTARVRLSAVPAVMQLPGVERLSLGWRLRPMLDISVVESRADDKRTQEPPLIGWNGKSVVVGIVDSGFDYQHSDFRNPNGTTRFYSIWDQNPLIGTPPAPFGYGNECTTAQINAGTCSNADPDGHGTHVTGIAAGDGSGTGNFEPPFIYTGMANAAQIIGVATDYSFQGVVDAVNYIFLKAAALGKPAVVNLSLGTTLGPHDGKYDFELALNALTGPGKVVVASAGNSQDTAEHGSANVTQGGGAVPFTFALPIYTASVSFPDYATLDFWHASANSYAVRIKRPSSATLLGPVAKGATQTFDTTDGRVLVDYTNTSDPFSTGSSEIYVEVNDGGGTAPRSGAWYVQLNPVSVPGDPKVHSWMDSFLGGGVAFGAFSGGIIDTTVNVSSPSTADSLISVAAYASKKFWASTDGGIYNFSGAPDPYQIAPFSSRGPRRDGAAKPDIAAAGAAIGSTLSADSSPPWPAPLILPDDQHLILQGTSMSAPQVTGAIAMLMQKYPTLTPSGAKQALAGAARFDATTGAVPNARWGVGRLDLTALLCNQAALPMATVTYPTPGSTLYHGTQVGLNWIALDDVGVTKVDLHYRLGFLGAWTAIQLNQANDGYFAWTVPAIVTDSLQVRVLAYDCVETNSGLSAFLPARAPSTDANSELPARFALSRPAPNPFVESAIVSFDLPVAPAGSWPVEVAIYNVAGRRMRTLVRGALNPGRYAQPWDGRDDQGVAVAAGIYFVRMSAGVFEARDRMVYLP
jgi:subtilisin family serine protease